MFVEKPLCLKTEELSQIKNTFYSLITNDLPREIYESKSGSVFHRGESRITSNGAPLLMVGYNRRFSTLTQIIKEKIASGPMSMIYRINAGAIPSDSWIQDIEVGGGRILGEVCHFVDYLTFINGSLPVSVFATAMNDANNHNDTLAVSLKYQNGSVGSVQYFSNGSKSLAKEHVEIYSHGVTAILNDFRGLKIYGKGRPCKKKLMSQDKGQQNEVKSFLNCILKGGHPPISLEEIFSASEVCFAILESLRSGTCIRLSALQ